MSRHDHPVTRQERLEQLLDLWAQGRKGQAAVLSLCHRALPEGEILREGMSVFEIIFDDEFGKPVQEDATEYRKSA